MESQHKVSSNGVVQLLRVAAVALSLAATVVIGLDNQTKTVPPLNVLVTAKWHYLSAFVYFFVANAIASAYGAISLVLTLASKSERREIFAMIVALDLVMVALLSSSFGAAAAVGVLGREGNSHVQWLKVCNVFDKFCLQGTAAMVLSGGASVVFFLLVAMAIFNLRNQN